MIRGILARLNGQSGRARGSADRASGRVLGWTVALALGAALAACAPAASQSATTGPTAPAAQGATPGGTATSGSTGAPSLTVTPLPGAANLAGATDICASAPSVSAQLPADVPPYNGDLRLGQTNNGDGVFGYCVSDSVDVVASFYTSHLPGKGWTGIQTFTNDATRNLIATHGSQSLTITVSPDAVQTGRTDLLIIVKGM